LRIVDGSGKGRLQDGAISWFVREEMNSSVASTPIYLAQSINILQFRVFLAHLHAQEHLCKVIYLFSHSILEKILKGIVGDDEMPVFSPLAVEFE
jgi:hypothetical protein